MRDFFSNDVSPAGDETRIPIYKLTTPLGEWLILATLDMFNVQRHPASAATFYLRWKTNPPALDSSFSSVFAAADAVREHRTKVDEWDHHDWIGCEGLSDWINELPDVIITRFVEDWITANPEGSLRGLDDFVRRDKMRLISRSRLTDCLEQMILGGKLAWLPSDSMCPAEMKRVVRLAKEHGIPVGRSDKNK
jgi:hypothetical protein